MASRGLYLENAAIPVVTPQIYSNSCTPKSSEKHSVDVEIVGKMGREAAHPREFEATSAFGGQADH